MLKSYWDDFPSRSMLGWRLPTQRHGGLITDAGFQNVRHHFDQAFRDSVSSWNHTKMDDLASYRTLRDRQLTGMDRPSSMVEEGNDFKVVMDVHGFIDNDLKVTFLNEKELIVEGLIEKKSEGSLTKQSFKRKFSFPGNVIVNSACSTLSSDNILTITVPKQMQQITQGETKVLSQETTQPPISHGAQAELHEKSVSSAQSLESKLASLMEFPITRRNDFFSDSFFDNDRSLFKSRVSEIMNRRTIRDSFSDFPAFRSLREKSEQNIAVSVTGDTKEHKIVLDVHGYNEGDLKVKAVNDYELLVEGTVEKKSDNSYCNNSFRRSFCLPNSTNIQAASSNLSSDGVLTILVPKREEKPLPIAYNIPVTMEKKMQKIQEKLHKERSSSPVIIPLGYENKNLFDNTSAPKGECIIPVQLEDNHSSTTTNQQITSTGQTQNNILKAESLTQNMANTQQILTNISTIEKEQTSSQNRSIPVLMEGTPVTMAPQANMGTNTQRTQTETCNQDTHIRQSAEENISSPECLSSPQQMPNKCPASDMHSPKLFKPRIVPIDVRGDFYNDSHFDAARQQVESAVKNAMNRSLSQEGHQTSLQAAEKEQIVTSERTGTSTVLDEIHSYKIMMDVFGFLEKDIYVKAVSENQLLVEGIMEQNNGNSITKHSFERTFHLPDNVRIEECSSVLSSDGMLNITVPKKVPTDNEILSAVSKTLTSESIETQLSNLSKQMDQISNIAGTAVQQGTTKEQIIPLNLEKSSVASAAKDTQSIITQTSQLESGELGRTSDTDVHNTHKDSFPHAAQLQPCLDLPVMRRGNFFQDAFFNDSRATFESALRNGMDRFKSFSSFSDDIQFYKNLRDEKFAGENLVTGISDDQQFKKVVVDVNGYPQDAITVKVVEGNGILVEGKVQEKMNAGFSTKSFRRTFFLPADYNIKDASSALSIDGILNIKVPRATQGSLTN